jgi:hypothetical protein
MVQEILILLQCGISLTYGFDFRYSTESNFYGRGSYFTDNTSYVKNYAFRLPTGERQIFIARVAAGKHEETRDIDKTIVKMSFSSGTN